LLAAGAQVPDAGAPDQAGTPVTQAFRDLQPQFAKAGAAVVGVSRDTVADQKKFALKYGVNFPLLMYGKKSIGIQRSTFLAAPEAVRSL
jgi:alkyl hydroperoxide reductase subunit AhpC